MAFGVILVQDATWSLVLVYLHLPIYQLHQYEEHDDDRFRVYLNNMLGGVGDVLSRNAVVFINVVGVWVLFTAVILGAALHHVGLGLAVVYPTFINALAHLGQAFVRKQYNPGLGTAVALLLPMSCLSIFIVGRSEGVETRHHLFGLSVGVVLHIAIIVHLRRRVAYFRSANAEQFRDLQ